MIGTTEKGQLMKKEELKQNIIDLNKAYEDWGDTKKRKRQYRRDHEFKCPEGIKDFKQEEPQKSHTVVPEPDLTCPTSHYIWGYIIGFGITALIGECIVNSFSFLSVLLIACFFGTFKLGNCLKKQEYEVWENSDTCKQIIKKYENDCEEAERLDTETYFKELQEYHKYLECYQSWEKEFEKGFKPFKENEYECNVRYTELYNNIALPEPLKSEYYRNEVLKLLDKIQSSAEYIIDVVMKQYLADKEIERANAEKDAQRSYERSEQAARDAEQASYDAEEMYRQSRDAKVQHMAEGAILEYAFHKYTSRRDKR